MYYYCTLFNANYLTRGIAMIKSLSAHTQDIHIYVLCFDDESLKHITALKLSFVTPIALYDFENEELLAIKSTRSLGEYCWSCTPAIIEYCIKTFNLPFCTYIDADVYFFENPNVIIDEMRENSILLTKHNYTPIYNQEATSGIYCVQFMCFKATQDGLEALTWWKQRCLEWCFARFEDGKFGDQKYLDDWTERFCGVYVPSNPRYALAPWNIQQFFHLRPIFYHFHALSFIGENKVDLGNYKLPQATLEQIYTPYIKELISLRETFMPHNFDLRHKPPKNLKALYHRLRRSMRGSYNVYPLTFFTSL